jgi:hypothetical protein
MTSRVLYALYIKDAYNQEVIIGRATGGWFAVGLAGYTEPSDGASGG